MLSTVIASLWSRRTRLFMSCLAIVLGTGFIAGTLIMGASMKQAFYDGFAAGAKNVDAAVTPRDAAGPLGRDGTATAPSLPPSVLDEVRSTPGVASVAGRVFGQAPILGSDGKVIASGGDGGLGISVAADPALYGFTVVSGRVPRSADEIVVDTATAADQHFTLGQTVKVVTAAGTVQGFRLVGTIDLGASKQFGSFSVAGFQTATALRVTGRPGYDAVVARAAPGVSQSALVKTLASELKTDTVETGSQLASAEASSATRFVSQFTTLILVFAVIALVVAAIVIYNTFTILITQRSRELALLRCVGASRRQVFTSTLLESLIVGLVASACGVVAGLGLAWGLQRLFAGFGLPVPSGGLVLTGQTILAAMGTGVLVTVGAAILPGRSATKVSPVAALGNQAGEAVLTRRVGRARVLVALVLLAAGVLLTVNGMGHVSGSGGFVEIAAACALCFLAVLALGPLIAPPIIAAYGWLLPGTTSRLAITNARRNPHRVAATTAALTIGMTVMTVFTVVASSAEASAASAIGSHYPFDYIVRASDGRSVPPSVISALTAASSLGVVAPSYSTPATANGQPGTDVGAIGAQVLRLSFRPPMVAGSLDQVGPGTAAVDSQAGLHVGVGGTVTVGTLRLRVVAVFNGADGPLPSVLMSVPDYLRAFRPSGADEVYVTAAAGVSVASSSAAVGRATASDPLVTVDTVAIYKSNLNSKINEVLALFDALLGLALLIALLGIANTLSLSVLERTRESALLRALGLTRGQLRLTLLTEALLMALLGVTLGVGLGGTFGAMMVRGFIKSAGGEGVISVPYLMIGIYALIGSVAGVAAAVLPARRAARTSVVAAMAPVLSGV